MVQVMSGQSTIQGPMGRNLKFGASVPARSWIGPQIKAPRYLNCAITQFLRLYADLPDLRVPLPTRFTMPHPLPARFSPGCRLAGGHSPYVMGLESLQRNHRFAFPHLLGLAPLTIEPVRQRSIGWLTGGVVVVLGEQSPIRITISIERAPAGDLRHDDGRPHRSGVPAHAVAGPGHAPGPDGAAGILRHLGSEASRRWPERLAVDLAWAPASCRAPSRTTWASRSWPG